MNVDIAAPDQGDPTHFPAHSLLIVPIPCAGMYPHLTT